MELTDSQKREKIKELKKKLNKTKRERDYAKAMQLALKLVLNGTYGAFCHPAFTVSNTDIANAITASAREVINWMLDHIENYFYNEWYLDAEAHKNLGSVYISKLDKKYFIHRLDGTLIDKWGRKDDEESTGVVKINDAYGFTINDYINTDKDEILLDGKKYEVLHKVFIADFSNIKPIPNTFEIEPDPNLSKDTASHLHRGIRTTPLIIYGDTDSIFSDTIIRNNIRDCTIEELYNRNIINGTAGDTLKGHESIKCNEKVLNWDNKLYYASVKRIIRHKVSKAKWKLKTKNGKEIIVTNDHSMIVFRNDEKIEVKPSEILITDKILTVLAKTQ